MEMSETVELPKKINEWSKDTFSKQVRAMEVGSHLVIESDYKIRMSKYINAKRSFPGATFSVQKQDDGSFNLIRIS
jgi:hypothetical protein